MALGIVQLEIAANCVVDMINAEEKLRSLNLPQLVAEGIDLDQSEIMKIAEIVNRVDLKDDELEAKVKALLPEYAASAALIIRLLRLVFPKQPKP